MIAAKRFALTCVLAALAGCGALPVCLSKGQDAAVAAIPGIPHAARSQSYMLPEAKSTDLLYVSEKQPNDVKVFTYPRGKLVGTFTGFSALFLCGDRSGNVSPPLAESGNSQFDLSRFAISGQYLKFQALGVDCKGCDF